MAANAPLYWVQEPLRCRNATAGDSQGCSTEYVSNRAFTSRVE
jgi:hypothetical protein